MSSGAPIAPGEHDRDAERRARHAGDPHGFGGLLGVLEVTVRGLHLGDGDRVLTAFVPAEPAERHLDPLHLVGGGQEPVSGRATAVAWSSRPSSPTTRSEGAGQLGDRQRLQAVVERVAVGERVGQRVDQRIAGRAATPRAGRRPVAGRPRPGGGWPRTGRARASARRRPRSTSRPALACASPWESRCRSASTPPGARLEGRGLCSHALELGQDLGVLAAVRRPSWACPQRLVELVELASAASRRPGTRRGRPAAAR